MNITVLTSDPRHPFNEYLKEWVNEVRDQHNITVAHSRSELTSGDFLFLVSCSDIIKPEDKKNYRHTLVLHASDLPKGRGWSPHIWDLVKGADRIVLCLLEAEEKVDTGRIWLKQAIPIKNTALWDEINNLLFNFEIRLMNEVMSKNEKIEPFQQDPEVEATYNRKRTPEDSEVNPELSIADQFDLIRICDPNRYPAWFEMRGQKYKLVVEKIEDE